MKKVVSIFSLSRQGRLLVLACLAVLAGCAGVPTNDAVSNASRPLEITEQEIHAADGRRLLHIDEVPVSIRVDAGHAFGASGRFTDAALSPDGGWLAMTTDGAAHGGGWLLVLASRELIPAAFQYGGIVTLGPWRDDGRYVVFAQEGPVPNRILVVVDREGLGDTVSDNSRWVRLPAHDEGVPPETEYHALEWYAETLLFEVDGARYRYDPGSAEITTAD